MPTGKQLMHAEHALAREAARHRRVAAALRESSRGRNRATTNAIARHDEEAESIDAVFAWLRSIDAEHTRKLIENLTGQMEATSAAADTL